MISVKDWMSKPVIMIKSDANVHDLTKKMKKHGIGCIVVSDDGAHLKGIVSERDIVSKAFDTDDEDVRKVLVKDIMTERVVTINEDTSLLEASKTMTKNVVRHIVVLNDDKNIVGIVTSRDLTQLMAG